jgi:acetylornithine deacetylase
VAKNKHDKQELLLAPAIMEDLNALLCIASMGGSEAEQQAQEFMAKHLSDAGLEVHTWVMDLAKITADLQFPGQEVERARGLGVLGIWRGTGGRPALLINGHTDVVPPGDLNAWSGDPFTPVQTSINGEDVVIARGACDMKGGLIAALAAVKHLRESGFTPQGDLLFAPVIGEEDGGLGTYSLVTEGLPRFYNLDEHHIMGAIIPEPTSLAAISANGGALTFRLLVHGAAIHASRRTEGVSAIEKFYPIYQALADFEMRRNIDVDPRMQRWPIAYPISIGTVHSGDWASTVPDLLIAEGRFGVALGEDTAVAQQEFEECISQACSRDAWLAENPVEIQWWGGQFASGQTEPDSQIIKNLATVHEQITETSLEEYGAPYGSDLRLLTGLVGIPTVQYGPGDAGVAHAPDEYVQVSELVTTARVIAELIKISIG